MIDLEKTLLRKVGEAIHRFKMIRDGDRVAVALSGGKDSVTLLEAMLHAAGYRVGAYTSPHLLRYNERVRVDRAMVGDAALCEAFARVD